MKEVDYIIVGQGLAGSVLAQQLLNRDQRILVIDQQPENSSSKIAAGLCNPVVFKRLTKSWMIDDVLETAKTFYRRQETLLSEEFYTEIPLYKLFVNEKEQQFWQQKSNEPDLFDWLNPAVEFPFNPNLIDSPHGAAHVNHSAFLQTEKWLNAFQKYLRNQQAFIAADFRYENLSLTAEGVVWQNVQAKKIIFCEGYRCIHNPYFDWLPFKLTKGEVLTIQFDKLKLDQAINKGVFILPYQENYKLGATYNWDDLSEKTSETGKHELLEKASRFIKDRMEVIDHRAGVRPTVSDRRPLLGIHPEHKQLLVFNGLGTKGVMLAPYFANKLVALLLENQALPREVNISRFLDSKA
ncbi:MAG: FAD-binding oxidoreductase [Flavobacteriales bacterium]|nr:FAD-binding oxidoreductase [Flavobacteriales bacterium]